MNNSSKFTDNFVNKCDVIRKIYKANPFAQNRTIKEKAKEHYGVDVSQQLIIFCIGKYQTRNRKNTAVNGIVAAKKYLEVFSDDLGAAIHWLKRASA